jgi:PAS domain S-box-containing protein
MPNAPDITSQLRRELDDTRLRLAEAEETLNAIRNGEVDGLVVAGAAGQQVFTLQGAQEPYRLLIEQMSEGALTLSRDGVILYANQPFAKMLQLPPGHIIGVALRDFVAPADRPALADLLEAALSRHTSEDVSVRIADGTVILLRLGLNRLQLGEESLLCAVATDITLERKRETDLRHLSENLEARITERTTDLAASRLAILSIMEEEVKARQTMETANRKLTQEITERQRAEAEALQSALKLQEKNAELERFLYTASHDLKSPLVTVRTFLGYLAQDMASADTERIEKDMRFMSVATDKMAQLLDDLLEISRIGRVASQPERVTFRNLVDETLSTVAGRITERGVTVKVGEHDVSLHGDRLRLEEIWQNLVENACKFMGDQKDPHIEIGVETLKAETVFFVRDNGMGIDPRYHAKVFALFERLDAKAEGTGVGLAIVKRIVDLYMGRIWMESSGLGKGTCFYFTLPGAGVGTEDRGQRTEDRGQRTEVGGETS